ncbi:MAG: 50S ribosomal protein L9 [Bacteroidales bacterium]|nr:50S ribosomal protein L9 [Bacteroidales bacterium]MBN2763545.1 50S ribosomal protein L9 [Bacteroidales bacterium]
MEVILKQDIPNLGYKDDIIKVKNGYAVNYLIPKGLAVNATVSAKKAHAEIIKQRAHKEAKVREEAEAIAEKLKTIDLSIGAKTSSKGKIFGSVNAIQIAEALQEKGFEIDRKNITFKEDLIKEVGKYHAKIKLHKEVQVEIPFEIVAE